MVNLFPFPDQPASVQFLNSRLYVLVQQGAQLPDGTIQVTPGSPPTSLIDPLFQAYNPINQIIMQFNLYKSWFYREAFQVPNVVQSIDCG